MTWGRGDKFKRITQILLESLDWHLLLNNELIIASKIRVIRLKFRKLEKHSCLFIF
jgi:hypothetical protein